MNLDLSPFDGEPAMPAATSANAARAVAYALIAVLLGLGILAVVAPWLAILLAWSGS